jgi:lipopolysaccharide/colanic/teichoic acid biosynthesis glycosyltransferase
MATITQPELVQATRAAFRDAEQDGLSVRVPRYFRWKTIPDRIVAVLLLIPATPILLLTVLVVRMTSRGPGIYRQARVGLRGKTFVMYKIRTMRQDAEAGSGPVWATSNDPRLTRVGRFLRSIHLDELPQLFNVIQGDMALVGPRPERPEFTHVLAGEIEGYMQRLLVRPGVTGLAQINLPPDSDYNSVRRKLILDLEYIRQAGIGLDTRILCWTALRACGLNGSTTRLLKLYRPVPSLAESAQSVRHAPNTTAMSAPNVDTVGVKRHGNDSKHVTNGHARAMQPVKPR